MFLGEKGIEAGDVGGGVVFPQVSKTVGLACVNDVIWADFCCIYMRF
jgi:hypothetical protein